MQCSFHARNELTAHVDVSVMKGLRDVLIVTAVLVQGIELVHVRVLRVRAQRIEDGPLGQDPRAGNRDIVIVIAEVQIGDVIYETTADDTTNIHVCMYVWYV